MFPKWVLLLRTHSLKRRFLGYEVIMLPYVDYNVDNNEINNTNFFNLLTPT